MLEREGRGDLGDADAPLTDGRRDQPYIPHLDRERRTKGSFRRADLAFGATASAFVCWRNGERLCLLRRQAIDEQQLGARSWDDASSRWRERLQRMHAEVAPY